MVPVLLDNTAIRLHAADIDAARTVSTDQRAPLEPVLVEPTTTSASYSAISARGNKSKAAELLGLASYQTLNNWMNKYGVKS
jgi:hypothetical protein